MNIIKKIKQLDLPVDDFLVVGSGPLAALGLRTANDIDLLVTPGLYGTLKKGGWNEHTYPTTLDNGLTKGDFEVVTCWHGIRLDDLIDSAVWFEGVAFANLEDVINWKSEMAREKDLRDLELIRRYRARRLQVVAMATTR